MGGKGSVKRWLLFFWAAAVVAFFIKFMWLNKILSALVH